MKIRKVFYFLALLEFDNNNYNIIYFFLNILYYLIAKLYKNSHVLE